jgi:Tfp pilus assembly protein PilF
VSLISEALKEAQRSHARRTSSKNTPSAGEAFFPYPEGRAPAQRSRNLFLIGGSAAIVLILGAAVVVKMRHRPSPLALPVVHAPAQAAAPVAPVASETPASGVTVATPPAVPASSPQQKGVASSPVTSTSAKHADAGAAPARTVASVDGSTKNDAARSATKAAADSTSPRSAPAAAPAPLAPAPAPAQSSSGAGVRVIVDAGSSRPGDSLFTQAYAEQVRGNIDRSKELYEKAIAQPQASAATFNNYGVLLLQNGNQLGASEMFKQAISRDEKSVDAWINLGDADNAIGHHADAMSAYARALQLDAANPSVKIRLAAEYQAIGDTATARRMFDDAAKQAPKDPNVHYKYGMFLQSQRDYRGAIREYQSFVDLAPGKFSAENIAMIRQYIVTLGRYVP